MLNTALRVESGLTYGAGSQVRRATQPGSVEISTYTRTDATAEAIDMALDVLDQLHAGAVDEAMLASAKNYILGDFPTEFETAAQIGEALATLETFALDASYVNDYGADIAAATTNSVAAVIDAVYPKRDDLAFVLLGDAELIREAAQRYGTVTEMAISEPHFRLPAMD